MFCQVTCHVTARDQWRIGSISEGNPYSSLSKLSGENLLGQPLPPPPSCFQLLLRNRPPAIGRAQFSAIGGSRCRAHEGTRRRNGEGSPLASAGSCKGQRGSRVCYGFASSTKPTFPILSTRCIDFPANRTCMCTQIRTYVHTHIH